MEIYIKDTGEIAELSIIDLKSGENYASELVGQYEKLAHDENDRVIMTKEQYDWWDDFLGNKSVDEMEIANLREQYSHIRVRGNSDFTRVDEIVDEETSGITDLNDLHDANQRAIKRIREELSN